MVYAHASVGAVEVEVVVMVVVVRWWRRLRERSEWFLAIVGCVLIV